MSRPLRVAAVSVCLAALALAVFSWARHREDAMTARLSGLLAGPGDRPLQPDEARLFLQENGTNAVIPLLQILEAGTGSPSFVHRAARRIPWLGDIARTYRVRREIAAAMVPWAFDILGTNAACAVPGLERLSQQGGSRGQVARSALMYVEENLQKERSQLPANQSPP